MTEKVFNPNKTYTLPDADSMEAGQILKEIGDTGQLIWVDQNEPSTILDKNGRTIPHILLKNDPNLLQLTRKELQKIKAYEYQMGKFDEANSNKK